MLKFNRKNDKNINNNFNKKYNPLKDLNFWVALVIGGAPILPYLIFKMIKYDIVWDLYKGVMPPFIIFLVVWVGWIIFKKGKKWSLPVGFIISATITFIVMGFTVYLEQKKYSEETLDNMINKSVEELRLELENKKIQQKQKQEKFKQIFPQK
ncbi:MAG: hypothetical protein U9O55_00435 [Patescibacteria group bacterium]|nr:hypothetical protein [Patescibacteria group bacterium]